MEQALALVIILTTLCVFDRCIYYFAKKEAEYGIKKNGRSNVSILWKESCSKSGHGKRSLYQVHKMHTLQKIVLRCHQSRGDGGSIAGQLCRKQWQEHKKSRQDAVAATKQK